MCQRQMRAEQAPTYCRRGSLLRATSRFKAPINGHQPDFDFGAAIQEKDEMIWGLRQNNCANVSEALEGVEFLEARASPRLLAPDTLSFPHLLPTRPLLL